MAELTCEERKALLWAIGLGLAYDDGFPWPRDHNRILLRAAREKLLSEDPGSPAASADPARANPEKTGGERVGGV